MSLASTVQACSRLIPSVLVVAFVSTAGIGPARAQELTGTLKKIKETGVLAVGHRETLMPFSYYDGEQRVVGYSADLCVHVVEAIKRAAKVDRLDVKLVPVTSASRIPLLSNGTIDLECGATTNNVERQKQVSFSVTHFVTSNRFVSKKAANLSTLEDLRGRTVVSVSGTTNIKQITELNVEKNLNLNILPVKDHAEAFLMVDTDRAVAFVMDDVILASFISNAKDPASYIISKDPLSLEPYGFMVRREDPAFKKVVDDAMAESFKNGTLKTIYEKWFLRPIPPKGNTLDMPMSDALVKVIANPTDSADPKAYN
jgi:glutamate/aspartate transport system substrate-binding protein